jgi:signal transduction histidine kinase
VRRLIGWFAPGREVQAMSDLTHLRGPLRLVAVFAVTVVLPGLVLAWLSFRSVRGEELAVVEEAKGRAERAADAMLEQTAAIFEEFETTVQRRLASGRSPLDALPELSPFLRVAFRLDDSGELAAPFEPPRERLPVSSDVTLSGAWLEAQRAELIDGDPARAAELYARVGAEARGVQVEALASFARARALQRAGRGPEALALYRDVLARGADVRDPNGFRLGDLARLKLAEAALQTDTAVAVSGLRALVEELLTRRWTLGVASEAPLIARALDLLDPHAPRDWLATSRGRLEDRSRMMFYGEQLYPELAVVTAGSTGLRVAGASVHYEVTHRTLWATLWYSDDHYAFALDRMEISKKLTEVADLTSRADPSITVLLTGPEERRDEGALALRSLAPWLPGWSIIIAPSDSGDISRSQARQRNERLVLISAALTLIAAGAVLSGRMVARELEIAREKADFAANVSHELRSPITQIRVKGEALQLGLIDDEDEAREHYDAIVREAERLTRLVNNVLDFAAIERGAKSYTLRPGDLGEAVRAAVETARYSAETRKLEMQLDLPDSLPVVRFDPEAIAQVMQNLISNAAKYGDKGGWIGVSAWAVPDGVEVRVSDRGIGIPAKDVPRVFDRFYRSGDSETRRRKGTGIGLTIVKYIMEAHGGAVRVASVPGEGTTFTIHFPTGPSATSPKERQHGQTSVR